MSLISLMAKLVMRHLLGYDNNLHTGFDDQVADAERPDEEGYKL